jgi:hypothetical protein
MGWSCLLSGRWWRLEWSALIACVPTGYPGFTGLRCWTCNGAASARGRRRRKRERAFDAIGHEGLHYAGSRDSDASPNDLAWLTEPVSVGRGNLNLCRIGA